MNKIRKLAKIAYKKWSKPIEELLDITCEFCVDAGKEMNADDGCDECNYCLAPKILCQDSYNDNTNMYILIMRTKQSKKNDHKKVMILGIISLYIFGRLIRPIEWYIKRYMNKWWIT